MVLNRAAPLPPAGLAGGRNPLWGPNFVEFEWLPNPERDVVGYRVYRVTGAAPSTTGDEPVCETKIDDITPTSCGAVGQPAGLQHYYVVATAPSRSGSGVEESARPLIGGTGHVDDNNARPDAPTNVHVDLVVDDGGKVTLGWDIPLDPDGTIRYYRIYRNDNTKYTVRYSGTGSGSQNVLDRSRWHARCPHGTG